MRFLIISVVMIAVCVGGYFVQTRSPQVVQGPFDILPDRRPKPPKPPAPPEPDIVPVEENTRRILDGLRPAIEQIADRAGRRAAQRSSDELVKELTDEIERQLETRKQVVEHNTPNTDEPALADVAGEPVQFVGIPLFASAIIKVVVAVIRLVFLSNIWWLFQTYWFLIAPGFVILVSGIFWVNNWGVSRGLSREEVDKIVELRVEIALAKMQPTKEKA